MPDGPAPVVTPDEAPLDRRRLRAFIGLTLARLGPRGHSAVAGVFLVLLVGEHTGSLVGVTFALTAHRLITWVAYPIAGRFSDHAHTSLGRRAPFMALGLVVLAGCTALYIQADTYWALVALLVTARLAQVAYRVPGAAVTPEAFGATRWLRAGIAVTLGGMLVGIVIRLTVIATWEQDDPTTWAPAYYLAAVFVAFAAISVLALVREIPAAERLADRQRVHIREPLRSMLSAPNAKVLLTGVLLAVATGGAFERAFPLYARDVLGAGGPELATAGLITTFAEIGAAIAGWFLASYLTRRGSALLSAVVGAVVSFAHLWVTSLWQSVALGLVSTVFFVAAAVSLTPLYLQLIPRKGGLGERIGFIWAPLIIVGMVSSYVSAVAVDLIGSYLVIWVITGSFSVGAGIAYLFLRLPPGQERTDTGHLWRTLGRLLWGRGSERRLFRGAVADGDADGASFIEEIQVALDPYTEPPTDAEEPAPPVP